MCGRARVRLCGSACVRLRAHYVCMCVRMRTYVCLRVWMSVCLCACVYVTISLIVSVFSWCQCLYMCLYLCLRCVMSASCLALGYTLAPEQTISNADLLIANSGSITFIKYRHHYHRQCACAPWAHDYRHKKTYVQMDKQTDARTRRPTD